MTNARNSDRSPGARARTAAPGFTLVEMSIAVFVIALILGGMLVPLATQVEQRQVSDTERTLQEIREALAGFAVANGYLPCPDKNTGVGGAGTANDGVEDVTAGGVCVTTSLGVGQGNLPWVTLGVGSMDVWGNRIRYQVTPAFSQRAPAAVFSLSSAGSITVCSASGCAAQWTTDAVAVVISLGKNGLGAINANTGTANPAPTSADENENVTGPSQFMSRTRTPVGSAAGEFDDVVIWVSKYTLFNRMVGAGKLP